MSYTKKQRDYYNAYRTGVCNKLGITKNEYNYIRRIGERLHSLYERNCNGTIEEQAYGDEVTRLRMKLAGYDPIIKNKLVIYHQTDPRGASIYLDNKPIPYNDYTTAYCIY